MSNAYTYSNPYLSLWQSAAAGVNRRHASQQKLALKAGQAPPTPQVDLEAPVHTLGVPLTAGQTGAVKAMFAPQMGAAPLEMAAAADVLHTVEDCAKAAAEFLWAEITGNKEESDALAGEIKDSECDPLWAECLADYLAFKAALGTPAYRKNKNPVFPLDANTRIAIVGDWGTGDDVASNLLQQVKTFNPDILLHLGDVYYSGTQSEQQTNFLNICKSVLGSSVRLFNLCGNHDMYSGGAGYYWLVDQIGQQASYFCLQNTNWQFLAMDTGHNDNDPFTVATNMTSLYQDKDWAEENWLLDKINEAGSRKQVLVSHHPLFSPFGSVGSADGGKPYAYNKNLHATFQAVLNKISCWFWGHQHTLAIYDPYMNLQRGRCVGASAVPVFKDQQSYADASGLQTYGGAPMPVWNPQGVLGNNGTDYNHCFALMTIAGPSATVDYYQVPVLKPYQKLPVTDSL
jgi:hypothetical protein